MLAGLLNGLLLRTEVDKVTGQLSDTRTRFLGVRRPKLAAVPVRGKRSMLTLSNRPWLVSPLTFSTCMGSSLNICFASHRCLPEDAASTSSWRFSAQNALSEAHCLLHCGPSMLYCGERCMPCACRGTLTWDGMHCNPCPMRPWTMPPALHQSSAQRDSVPSLGIHSASSPLRGSGKPSISRCPSHLFLA